METILLTIAIFNILNIILKRNLFKLEIENHKGLQLIQLGVYIWSYLYVIYTLIKILQHDTI